MRITPHSVTTAVIIGGVIVLLVARRLRLRPARRTAVVGGVVVGCVSQVRRTSDGALETCGGWIGLAAWIAVILVRLGESLVLSKLISPAFLGDTALMLVSLAIVRLVSVGVLVLRAELGSPLQVSPTTVSAL